MQKYRGSILQFEGAELVIDHLPDNLIRCHLVLSLIQLQNQIRDSEIQCATKIRVDHVTVNPPKLPKRVRAAPPASFRTITLRHLKVGLSTESHEVGDEIQRQELQF